MVVVVVVVVRRSTIAVLLLLLLAHLICSIIVVNTIVVVVVMVVLEQLMRRRFCVHLQQRPQASPPIYGGNMLFGDWQRRHPRRHRLIVAVMVEMARRRLPLLLPRSRSSSESQ